MFQVIPVAENNMMAFKVSGKLTDADYQNFLPQLNAFIEASQTPVSLLVELEDFHGWDKKAAWDDFRFGMAKQDDIERLAIVGEHRWQKWMTMIGNAFTVTQMRYFSRDELSDAWRWLRQAVQAESEPEIDEYSAIELLPYRHILLATDFSPHSTLALKRAVELAKNHGAKLSLVHAVEQVVYPADSDFLIAEPYDYLQTDQLVYDNALERLASLAKKIELDNVRYEVTWGSPKYAVLSCAEAQNVDLIVAGSHGRHGLARLLGSTASRLVNNASCDVVVVRIP